MQRLIFFLLLGTLLLPAASPLSAQENERRSPPDARIIAREALFALPPGQWDMEAVLITRGNKTDSDTPTERALSIQLRILPGSTREIIYASANVNEQDEGVRVRLFRDGAIKLIDLNTEKPARNLQAVVMESAFTIEDVSLSFLSWPKQEYLAEETVRGRRCWKIRSRPGSPGVSAYTQVDSWIDQTYRALLQATAFNSAKQVAKEFRVKSFKEFDGVWMLKTLELLAPAQQSRSRLEIQAARKVD
ncbi:MAG: outer membrane lipoprotein-sorting protein [Verrucomicrobiae bacterium]|nr:outer membrane lipoprotein-sorting protein [Verrucomicrobiae bacterium]